MALKPIELNIINDDQPANTDDSVKRKPIDSEGPEDENNLESVLSELKLSGRYHLKFLVLISLLAIISAQHSVNYIFSVENIDYRCRYNICETTALSRVQSNSTIDYKCHKYELLFDNGTCTEDNFDVSKASECTQWVYGKPKSFVAEFDLGCEDWKWTLVGTMHNIGCMIGLLFTGPLSDKIGRKRLIIISVVIAGVIGVTKSLVTSYWLFNTLEMLEPMFGDFYSATFTIAIETVTKEHRPLILLLISICTAMGQVLMAVLAYSIQNWRLFLISIYGPAFFFILYIFWMDESLRWLLIKGKKIEAEETIRRAVVMNKIALEKTRIDNLTCESNTANAGLWKSIKITISSRKLFTRFLICICLWFTSLFNTFALLINSVTLEGDKYINYGLVSLSGAVSGFILLYVLKRFKRKAPLIFSLTLTGLFCLTQSFIPKEYRWLSILLYICGKMNTSVSLRISYLYTTELFPTYTRNTMLALCSSFGRTATILAPQTPLLLKYWSGLPTLLVGVLSLVTATVVTLMPDTSEDVLPDDVQQAEAVGSKQKIKKNLS